MFGNEIEVVPRTWCKWIKWSLSQRFIAYSLGHALWQYHTPNVVQKKHTSENYDSTAACTYHISLSLPTQEDHATPHLLRSVLQPVKQIIRQSAHWPHTEHFVCILPYLVLLSSRQDVWSRRTKLCAPRLWDMFASRCHDKSLSWLSLYSSSKSLRSDFTSIVSISVDETSEDANMQLRSTYTLVFLASMIAAQPPQPSMSADVHSRDPYFHPHLKSSPSLPL